MLLFFRTRDYAGTVGGACLMRLGVVTLMLAVVLVAVGCFFSEPEMLDDVWCFSSSDVFAVGTSGTIVHYDGREWSSITGWSTPEE